MHESNDKSHRIPEEIIARLVVITGIDSGKCFNINMRMMKIGRMSQDIQLRDPKVSSLHATIEYIDGNFFIFDNESTNGTFVDGKRVKESPLKDGCEIKIGLSTLRFIYTLKKEQIKQRQNKFKGEEARTVVKKPTKAETNSSIKQQTSTEKISVTSKNLNQNLGIYFEIIEGNDRDKKITIDRGTLVIGRVEADINLRDTDVSRKHLMVETFAKDRIYARDLASTNGTYVNDKKIASCKLNNGDRIKLGKTVLKLFINK